MSRIRLSQSEVGFLSQGAILHEFVVAGHNLVLSCPTADLYLQAPYFGETIGRVANRIKSGTIVSLNGKPHQLSTNEGGKNHLHGGNDGWGHQQFGGPHSESRKGRDATKFTYVSQDGEEGYPGTVELRVWYTAYEETSHDIVTTVLEIEYEVEMVGKECAETIVNVTNHSYFNLGDGPTIEGTEMTLETSTHLLTDAGNIPTGKIAPFPGIKAGGTFTLGAEGPSIDHCFVMTDDLSAIPIDTRGYLLRKLMSAYHPSTSMHLEVHSTEPAFQFYTGDSIKVVESEQMPPFPPRAGFCIEPSRYINAVNVPEWKAQVVLKQGEIYGSRIVYRAWQSLSH